MSNEGGWHSSLDEIVELMLTIPTEGSCLGNGLLYPGRESQWELQ